MSAPGEPASVIITDAVVSVVPKGRLLAVEVCLLHGKSWLEGENFERTGGRACEECVDLYAAAINRRDFTIHEVDSTAERVAHGSG